MKLSSHCALFPVSLEKIMSPRLCDDRYGRDRCAATLCRHSPLSVFVLFGLSRRRRRRGSSDRPKGRPICLSKAAAVASPGGERTLAFCCPLRPSVPTAAGLWPCSLHSRAHAGLLGCHADCSLGNETLQYWDRVARLYCVQGYLENWHR